MGDPHPGSAQVFGQKGGRGYVRIG
ncbi:MAG: hypothetical protein QG552_2074, partial [Thermodesulfobacteriota bacterium]|nr:hypothetical protein [Thermodesulfobacteriota bacterium]